MKKYINGMIFAVISFGMIFAGLIIVYYIDRLI